MSPIPTKFEVDMTVHCRVIAFLFADTARDLVTLTFDLLTLNSYHTWRFKWPTLPPSVKTLRLFVHELRVITVPIDYHWKCVRGHCACAESRDLWLKCVCRSPHWHTSISRRPLPVSRQLAARRRASVWRHWPTSSATRRTGNDVTAARTSRRIGRE